MSLLRRPSESYQHSYKKQRRFTQFKPVEEDMPLFASSSSQFLSAPLTSKAKFQRSQQDVDDSDLELSFASNVSLHSPPRPLIASTSESDYAEPMDISPCPPTKPVQSLIKSRPRASTSAARMFGRDASNDFPAQLAPPASIRNGSTSGKRTQRAALPNEWLSARSTDTMPRMFAALAKEPSSPIDDPMDVDTSFVLQPAVELFPTSHSAAPTMTSFKPLFFDPVGSMDSSSEPQTKKRRSLSPDPARSIEHEQLSSPSNIPLSSVQHKLARLESGSLLNKFNKPTLQGLGAPSGSGLKRNRAPLSAMVHPSDEGNTNMLRPHSRMPPVRRAFSALLPPTAFETSSDESSFDGLEMSSPAQAYAKRQHVKTIRRCDGTDDFRPLTGATAMKKRDLEESPSRIMGGLPGFGDNEAHGKILPCHRVTEDGLMRIQTHTLDALIDGQYNNEIADFHVIDCRFDYEYAGGHIPDAININTTAGLEALLLGSGLKPKACISGDSHRKTILVFHCEFSAKRAPTFAKHLRAKDRALNNHVYPKIHYPEVYILEGGYCQYFKSSAFRCQPQAYVTMDDPTHAASRREDLDQFRRNKFGRHKSYAYGEGVSKNTANQLSKRNTAPSGGTTGGALFAAANAARSRRGGGGGALMTLAEDNNQTHSDDEETDIGDSPCPPPNKASSFKVKKLGGRAAPLLRAETYGPTRMPY